MKETERNFALYSRMVSEVPETKPAFDELVARFEGKDPGLHNVFGDVLSPLLTRNIPLNLKGARDLVSRAVAFIEYLASREDEDVLNAVHVTICEHIVGSGHLEAIQDLLGPKTRAICLEIIEWDRDFDPQQPTSERIRRILRRLKDERG